MNSEKRQFRKARRVEKRRKKRGRRSIFFLLWGAISLMCMLVLLAVSVTQRILLSPVLTSGAEREVESSGTAITEQLSEGIPEDYESEGEYIKHLLKTYGEDKELRITLFAQNGQIIDSTGGGVSFSDSILPVKEEITPVDEKARGEVKLFQEKMELKYAAYIPLKEPNEGGRYLYIIKDVSYMDNVVNGLTMVLILPALGVCMLAFGVAAAISGILTKPIREIEGKAKLLAKGDFTVDFHGSDYSREIKQLAESLNFARDELSKSDKMQKELIANVSHDFKTPLTMIKAYASMIVELDGNDAKKREKHAGVIVEETDRLASLVGDLLDLSKLQSGISILTKEKFDVSAYTRRAIESLGYFKEKGGYEFITNIEEGLWIEGDKIKIGQVLHNLIGNAINYTGEDKKVYISLRRQGDFAHFSVRDTGEGIAEEDLAGIWDRYYRSGKPHKRPVQGTGLGLSIVRQVLEIHGFDFGAESKAGEGSVFFVDFPCVEIEN